MAATSFSDGVFDSSLLYECDGPFSRLRLPAGPSSGLSRSLNWRFSLVDGSGRGVSFRKKSGSSATVAQAVDVGASCVCRTTPPASFWPPPSSVSVVAASTCCSLEARGASACSAVVARGVDLGEVDVRRKLWCLQHSLV